MTASNTRECFREFIGQSLKGMIFNVLPLRRCDLSKGTKTMIFEDGRGLTIAGNGSYWIDSKADVDAAIEELLFEFKRNQADLAGILAIAGVKP